LHSDSEPQRTAYEANHQTSNRDHHAHICEPLHGKHRSGKAESNTRRRNHDAKGSQAKKPSEPQILWLPINPFHKGLPNLISARSRFCELYFFL